MTLESMLVNSIFRRLYFKFVEAPILTQIAKSIKPINILEIGGGNGLISRRLDAIFKPLAYTMIDTSADNLPFPSNQFDTVIELCCFHHVDNWQRAIEEVKRVLKPGGIFIFEDFGSESLVKWRYKYFDHPKANRFSQAEFMKCLPGSVLIDRTFMNDAFIGVFVKETT